VLKSSIVSKEDIEKCEEIILLAISEYPTHKNSVLPNYLLGVVNQKLKNYIEAKNYFKIVYETEPTIFENQIAYANSLRENAEYSKAEEVLNLIDELNQNKIEVLKQKSYLAFEQNQLDLAESYVAKVLQNNPGDLDFVLFRAKILIEKKDYIRAVSLLDMYERRQVYSLEYFVLRAKLQLYWSKNTNAALETVERTLQLYPDSSEILMLAASIASMTDAPVAGKYADELASILLEKDPNNKEALMYQIDGFIYNQNYEEAYDWLDNAAKQGHKYAKEALGKLNSR
jgi:tetratricopeptide (TPR) repeat protein